MQEDFNQSRSDDDKTPVKHRVPSSAVVTKPSSNQEHDDSSDSFLASREDDRSPPKAASSSQEWDRDGARTQKPSSAAPTSLFTAPSQKKPSAVATPPRKSHDADDYGDDFEDYGDDFEEGNNAAEEEAEEVVEEADSDGVEEELSVGGMNQVRRALGPSDTDT